MPYNNEVDCSKHMTFKETEADERLIRILKDHYSRIPINNAHKKSLYKLIEKLSTKNRMSTIDAKWDTLFQFIYNTETKRKETIIHQFWKVKGFHSHLDKMKDNTKQKQQVPGKHKKRSKHKHHAELPNTYKRESKVEEKKVNLSSRS